jgi:tRNA pseudouridine38-40 synthase
VPAWCPDPSDRERLLCFEVAGTGLLRHMVRAMAGTLVLAGNGRLTPLDVARALAGGRRSAAGPTAPAHGLHLWHVHYPGEGPAHLPSSP